MTYREKKVLLHNLFHGESEEERAGGWILLPGKKRGIYVKKNEDGTIEVELLAEVFVHENLEAIP